MIERGGQAPPRHTEPALYSVGQVARDTGLSPHTLRMWERRYARPLPVRSASGHRRYTDDQLLLLRRVAEGVAGGLRPGLLLSASPEELDRLLSLNGSAQREPLFDGLEAWVGFVSALDGESLARGLRDEALRLGPLDYLEDRITPLLREVGRRWADGRLEVRHEHLCAEVVEDVLRATRHRIEPHVERWRGSMTLATLTGERHGLGLLMASIVCATRGVRCQTLGVETPLGQVLAAARDSGADALGISVSLATAGVDADRAVARMRDSLPADLPLVIGGSGTRRVRRSLDGVTYFDSLRDFDRWLGEKFVSAT